MRGSRKFCQVVSNCDVFFFFFFLVDEGREDSNTTIMVHHRPASETQFKWRFAGVLGSFMIFRGSRPVLLRNPIFFMIFQGCPNPLPPPPLPLGPHMQGVYFSYLSRFWIEITRVSEQRVPGWSEVASDLGCTVYLCLKWRTTCLYGLAVTRDSLSIIFTRQMSTYFQEIQFYMNDSFPVV